MCSKHRKQSCSKDKRGWHELKTKMGLNRATWIPKRGRMLKYERGKAKQPLKICAWSSGLCSQMEFWFRPDDLQRLPVLCSHVRGSSSEAPGGTRLRRRHKHGAMAILFLKKSIPKDILREKNPLFSSNQTQNTPLECYEYGNVNQQGWESAETSIRYRYSCRYYREVQESSKLNGAMSLLWVGREWD